MLESRAVRGGRGLCGGAFHCGIDDAAACPCATLALDTRLL
jgi:hypothetical protein